MEHEASTSKIGEDQIFYCKQRGIATEDAVSMIVNGFCKEVFRELPMEFAVEAQKLLGRRASRGKRRADVEQVAVPWLRRARFRASTLGSGRTGTARQHS